MNKCAIFHQRIKIGAGDALHFKLSHPIEYVHDGQKLQTFDVVISATTTPKGEQQTYMFPANNNGDILTWIQHRASLNGTLDHEEVLRNAGYEAV